MILEANLYNKIVTGTFLKRPNRFIAHVLINGKEEIAHVKNTSRMKELLKPGTKVLLEDNSSNINRKTKFSLISAWKGDMLINIDSQVPNSVVYKGILDGKVEELKNISSLKPEVKYKNSRFDIAFEQNTPEGNRKGFIEIKGVTLEHNGYVAFPGAPTTRGVKHVLEMADAVKNGYLGYIIFLVQLTGIKGMCFHMSMDKNFAESMVFAKENGVQILAYDSIVTENDIVMNKAVPIDFSLRETTEFIYN